MNTFENKLYLLSTAYFAPIQYFTKLVSANQVYIEQFEHFTKQTYRNRCVIMGGNGLIPLVIPVVSGRGSKIPVSKLKISYDTQWQRNHWRTIFSAYNSSPFFEYYQDEIMPFFNKKWKYLFEYNMEILHTICDILEIETNFLLTSDFENIPLSCVNYRETISPKNKTIIDPEFHPVPYTQVFSERFGFSPNLSILDLLFNVGPNSLSILEESTTANLE